MLPLVDKPVIQYAVEEAVAAGIEQVIIVTSSQKRAIEDHFDLSYELEHLLEEKGEIEKLRQVRHITTSPRSPTSARRSSSGLGHAILMTKDLIGNEPFAVLLPDDVGDLRAAMHRPADPRLRADPCSVVAVMQVPRDESDPLRHGRRRDDGEPARWRPVATRMTRIVEKPAPAGVAIDALPSWPLLS
jgi:UTP--glucose-1-phosphate uridylyltransferase